MPTPILRQSIKSNALIIKKLVAENFRNLERIELQPHRRLNDFSGPNGAGKTSVIESLVVLSRGRSFRTRQARDLIGTGAETFRIYAETESDSGTHRKLGLERSGNRWRGRKDGRDLTQISQLTRALPLVLIEPDSHLLVSGAPEVRRKYLDWALFHVEPRFLDTWRRYARSLKQRNAALRRGNLGMLEPIDAVLSEDGSRLSEFRGAFCEEIGQRLREMMESLAAGLPDISMSYRRGWHESDLLQALESNRERDAQRGQTGSGPHRADLHISCGHVSARNRLSRGEQKLLSAGLLLVQAEILAGVGERPLLLFDDLASEFDAQHCKSVMDRALRLGGQLWVTGTRQGEHYGDGSMFHVKRGVVREMV